MPPLSLTSSAEGTTLKVRASPGSKHERIVGIYGNALKIAVHPPAEDGRANERLLALLAKALGLAAHDLVLVAGEASRDKRIRIARLTPSEIEQRLAPHLRESE